MRKSSSIRCVQENCGCSKNSFVWISHTHHIIWFEVPKVASTTIKKAFAIRGCRNPNKYDFINCQITPLEASLTYPDYFKFAIIRNPWERIVSAWSMFCKKGDDFRNKQIENLFGFPSNEITFSRFVILASKFRNHHWEQMVAFLPRSRYGKLLIDDIGRLEQLDKFIESFNQKTNLNISIETLNKSNHTNHLSYYTPDIVKIVEALFVDDISVFGLDYPALKTSSRS